ncbi:MAG: hypothetical protein V7L04_10750 [Nostoc sp.]
MSKKAIVIYPELLAAESFLDCVRGCRILANKPRFIGGEWQRDISQTHGPSNFHSQTSQPTSTTAKSN